MRLDRYAAADALGVTTRQFRQLIRNPTFPQPVAGRPPDEEWAATDIAAFVRKIEACRQKGLKVPECLYEWVFETPPTREEKAARWEIRRRKLLAGRRKRTRGIEH